jgi:hypothetical protein
VGFFSELKTRSAIRDLTERLETVERALKATKLEWEDTYDRMRRMMGRIAKRGLPDEANTNPEAAAEPAADGPGFNGVSAGGLTPRQRELQQQILRHRAGMRG